MQGSKLKRLRAALGAVIPSARFGLQGYMAIGVVALAAMALPGSAEVLGVFALAPTPAVVQETVVPAVETQLVITEPQTTPTVPEVAPKATPVAPTLEPTAVAPVEPTRVAEQSSPSTRGGEREATPAPTQAPQPTATPALKVPTGNSVQERFIATTAADAQQSQRETGVPASVTLAQAMLESANGTSGLAVKGKNYFGIKAQTRPGPAGIIEMPTWEVLNGKNVTVMAAFRAYNSAAESFADHGRFFTENRLYAQAMRNVGDAKTFAQLIHKAGYATDPAYSDKLIKLMDKYNLYQYDLS
ncbi:MAG: glucosaminidase domain-containing protein [Chloroflexota bacterium]